MRIWHEKLIPHLCQKHLCGLWREGLGCIQIVLNKKKGYSNHPAVKEFQDAPLYLLGRMLRVRHEMLRRGYHPKEIDIRQFGLMPYLEDEFTKQKVNEWQTLEEQIEVLKQKGCRCDISILQRIK